MSNDNNSKEKANIELLEIKVMRFLSWIFFFPVMLVFYAFKHNKHKFISIFISFLLINISFLCVIKFASDYTDAISYRQNKLSSNTLKSAEEIAVTYKINPSQNTSDVLSITLDDGNDGIYDSNLLHEISRTNESEALTNEAPVITSDTSIEAIATSEHTAAEEISDIVYVTKTGTKYHKADCYMIIKSKTEMSLSDAKLAGYTSCKKCFK